MAVIQRSNAMKECQLILKSNLSTYKTILIKLYNCFKQVKLWPIVNLLVYFNFIDVFANDSENKIFIYLFI